MENMFVFAAATGRTLVMPPEQKLYLLDVSLILYTKQSIFNHAGAILKINKTNLNM